MEWDDIDFENERIHFFTIAKWVGHRNTKMIEEVYGHLNPEFRREQMAMLRVV